jgi:hypothetical protein
VIVADRWPGIGSREYRFEPSRQPFDEVAHGTIASA